jgi:hypothetical protein
VLLNSAAKLTRCGR